MSNLHSDDVFLPRFKDGHWWTVYVARELRQYGFNVKCEEDPEKLLRPDVRVRDAYSDNGDIEIYNKYLKKWQMFEVKSRKLEFGGKSDIPFKDFFIDNVSAWNKKISRNYIEGIFFVSQITAAILFLPVKPTRKHWTVAKAVADKGTKTDKFQIPTSYLRSVWDFIYAYGEG